MDACCGTGASALPAAQLVGVSGRVIGVDLAEPALALALARTKARSRSLRNVDFQAVDVENTGLPSGSFDAVVCVFGVFFLPDMAGAVAEMWRLVRPGGVLAITVWGSGWLEPATTGFWAAVEVERPDLVGGFRPWTRVTDPDALSELLRDGGAISATVEAEPGVHPLADPADWWTIAWLRQHEVTELQANVVYARACKPARSS